MQVFGEVVGFKAGRAKVWFELRDGAGALPCSMWREDFEALGIGRAGRRRAGRGGGRLRLLPRLAHGVAVVLVRGVRRCASPARATCWPSSSGCAARSHAEGLFEPQKRLPRRTLPRTIGVVCGEQGKARDDVLAALRRRGWGGRVVWAFAPVQDRHAAPAVTRALQDLAACAAVDVIVVARGGGSLADLFAFCDETLCRTVALLRVPVISSVGHHTDRTLLDDVAAVACSTPTHAAEAAVPLDCTAARAALRGHGGPARAPGPPRDRRPRPRAGAPVARARRPRRPPPRSPAPAAARAARGGAPPDRRRRAPQPHGGRRAVPQRRRRHAHAR